MINTVEIKKQQLESCFYKTGSGQETILVMGSCRVVNYVTYLKEWNEANGNRFTIYSTDPFNFNWDINDNRVDFIEVINKLESNENILSVLKSTSIFIHEYYNNFGLFCCDKKADKNIYQFGLNPAIDICIPNFNDYFILFSDIVTFDLDLRKKAIQDYNVISCLSAQTVEEIFDVSQRNLSKFYNVCMKSDVPEMKEYFQNNFRKERLFWSYNHTSKYFTLAVFNFINDKFLHLDLSKGFNKDHEDIFANNYTRLTEYDIKMYDYDWGEEIIPLQTKLF